LVFSWFASACSDAGSEGQPLGSAGDAQGSSQQVAKAGNSGTGSGGAAVAAGGTAGSLSMSDAATSSSTDASGVSDGQENEAAHIDARTEPIACTPKKPHAAGDSTVNLDHGGLKRDYVLHVPTGYDGSKRLPVVVDLHGYTSYATEQLARTRWGDMADKEGFLVVEPDGVDRSWNVKVCCGTAQKNNVDDVGFIRTVVTRVESDLCVDDKRVYASGHSNGAAMTFLLACEAADIFAAVAPVCGATNQPDSCHPTRPIPIAMIRAKNDGAVPYQGKPDWESAQADLAKWQELDHCAPTPVVASHAGVCQTNTQCAAGTNVMLCSPRGDHLFFFTPSDNPDNLLVPDTVWPFFAAFALP
jgi:polyhydroxybutyrate depolymerase